MADSNGFMGALLPALLLGIVSGGKTQGSSGGLLGSLMEREEFNSKLREEERSKHASMQRGSQLEILTNALVDSMTEGKKNLFTDSNMDFISQALQSDRQLLEIAQKSAAEQFAMDYLTKEAKSFNDMGMTPPEAFTNYDSTTEDLLKSRATNPEAFQNKATMPSLLSMMAQQNVPPDTTGGDIYGDPAGMLGNLSKYREVQKNADTQRSKDVMAYQKSLYPSSESETSGGTGSGISVNMKDLEKATGYLMPSSWDESLGDDYSFSKDDVTEIRNNIKKNIDPLTGGDPKKKREMIQLFGRQHDFDPLTVASFMAAGGVPHQISKDNTWQVGLALAKQAINSRTDDGSVMLTPNQLRTYESLGADPTPEEQRRIGNYFYKEFNASSIFDEVDTESPVTGGGY